MQVPPSRIFRGISAPHGGDSAPIDCLTINQLASAKGFEQFKQQHSMKLVDTLNFEEVLKLSEDKRRSEIRGVIHACSGRQRSAVGPARNGGAA